MSKCKHGHCLDCGDMCPKCGDDDSKYNVGETLTCEISPGTTISTPTNTDFTTKALPEDAWQPQAKKTCPDCGVLLADMSSIDKDYYFANGKCKNCGEKK